MTDHGYTPTRQEVQTRQVAVDATNHWWLTRVEAVRRRVQILADTYTATVSLEQVQSIADEIDSLIAERERP